MNLGKTLEKNKAVAYGVACVLLAAALVIYFLNSDPAVSRAVQSYYSDDDGKTYFADQIDRVPPFDHNGRIAHQAIVVRAGNGKPFVGYLQSYTETGSKRLSELQRKPASPERDFEIDRVRQSSAIVKKPGGDAWVPMTSGPTDVLNPTPPTGESGALKMVTP